MGLHDTWLESLTCSSGGGNAEERVTWKKEEVRGDRLELTVNTICDIIGEQTVQSAPFYQRSVFVWRERKLWEIGS